MFVTKWHPGTLGLLWTADLLLLLMLVPANAGPEEMAVALALWAVPTAVLVFVSLHWWRHRRQAPR